MTNYLQLGQNLMKHFPQMEGCTSTIKLGKKGLEQLSKKNPELGKAIAELTEGVSNPTIEIAQKAQGNYAIAGFKIRNGETVLSKGAYSTSNGANGVVEKMHLEQDGIITTISKENGKTKMNVVEEEIIPKFTTPQKENVPEVVKPQIPELSHEQMVDQFFKLESDVIKGLDPKNHFIQQDISNLSPESLLKLKQCMDEAYKAGYKIPYDKNCEYIEMMLPMTDGRMFPVKVFPHVIKKEGNVGMRIYVGNDIPKDCFKTYHDVGINAGARQHPGSAHQLPIHANYQQLDFIDKNVNGSDVYGRLTARKRLADLIKENWTEKEANYFIETYNLDTRSHLRKLGSIQSPLKPSW